MNMLSVMMMTEEMGTVLIGEAVVCLLINEAMIVGDPQVHTVEIGLVLTMAVDLIQVLDLNQEEVLIMTELQAQSMIDITGMRQTICLCTLK